MATRSQEKIGELFVFASIVFFAFFPIFAHTSSRAMPPLLFAGISNVVTGILFFCVLAIRGQLRLIFNKKAFPMILAVTLLNIVIPLGLIYTGAAMTSGINTALLLQTEIIFTLLICGIFYKEKITRLRIVGAAILFVGAAAVLYNGSFALNKGDLLIIAAVIFYPSGNVYAKRALSMTTPSVLLFLRTIIGGPILIALSLLLEKYTSSPLELARENMLFILLNGLIVLGIAKIFWFEGLKRLDISKAIAVGIAQPAFNILYAYILLREVPTTYQLAGLLIIIAGLFVITKDKKHSTVMETTG